MQLHGVAVKSQTPHTAHRFVNDKMHGQDYAAGLLLELWAKILGFVEADLVDNHTGFPGSQIVTAMSVRKQAQYYSLQLVCKKFRDTFVQYPSLSRTVVLPEQGVTTSLPCLLAWLRQGCRCVELLASYGDSSCLDVALATVAVPGSHLTCLLGCNISRSAVCLLPGFTHLRCCDLTHPYGECLDLQSLQGLPNLVKLRLRDGEFDNVQAAQHLTNLYLEHTCAVCAQESACVGSLRKLRVLDSHVLGMHAQGICAYTALQHLECLDCVVSALNPLATLHVLYAENCQIPSSITLLTNLERLTVSFGRPGRLQPLDWIYQMTPLHALHVVTEGAYVIIASEFSRLQQLTLLEFTTHDTDWIGMLETQVNWKLMPGLKCIYFRHPTLRFHQSMLSLALTPTLVRVCFEDCHATDQEGSHMFDVLAHDMARQPTILFEMDNINVEDD